MIDQVSHTRARPKRRLIPEPFRPLQQQLLETFPVDLGQLRLPSRPPGLPQGFLAAAAELVHPPADGLPTDAQAVGYFRLVQLIPLPQADGFHSSLLQRLEIASHSGRIAHTSVNPSSCRKCRYIIRTSINVPPVRMKKGDFGEIGPVYDPETIDASGARQQFPGNQIPS